MGCGTRSIRRSSGSDGRAHRESDLRHCPPLSRAAFTVPVHVHGAAFTVPDNSPNLSAAFATHPTSRGDACRTIQRWRRCRRPYRGGREAVPDNSGGGAGQFKQEERGTRPSSSDAHAIADSAPRLCQSAVRLADTGRSPPPQRQEHQVIRALAEAKGLRRLAGPLPRMHPRRRGSRRGRAPALQRFAQRLREMRLVCLTSLGSGPTEGEILFRVIDEGFFSPAPRSRASRSRARKSSRYLNGNRVYACPYPCLMISALRTVASVRKTYPSVRPHCPCAASRTRASLASPRRSAARTPWPRARSTRLVSADASSQAC